MHSGEVRRWQPVLRVIGEGSPFLRVAVTDDQRVGIGARPHRGENLLRQLLGALGILVGHFGDDQDVPGKALVAPYAFELDDVEAHRCLDEVADSAGAHREESLGEFREQHVSAHPTQLAALGAAGRVVGVLTREALEVLPGAGAR